MPLGKQQIGQPVWVGAACRQVVQEAQDRPARVEDVPYGVHLVSIFNETRWKAVLWHGGDNTLRLLAIQLASHFTEFNGFSLELWMGCKGSEVQILSPRPTKTANF